MRMGNMKRTVFSNRVESQPNVTKRWYGVIDTEKTSYRIEYPFPTRNRSLARKWLEKEAKSVNGKLVAFRPVK